MSAAVTSFWKSTKCLAAVPTGALGGTTQTRPDGARGSATAGGIAGSSAVGKPAPPAAAAAGRGAFGEAAAPARRSPLQAPAERAACDRAVGHESARMRVVVAQLAAATGENRWTAGFQPPDIATQVAGDLRRRAATDRQRVERHDVDAASTRWPP